MTASRSTVYGSAAGIAGSYRSHGLASLGTDHREAENTVIIANQELRETCFSSVASVRRMALIGSFATRAVMPSRCGSLSLSPTCASRASVNMQHRTSRSPVLRFPPAKYTHVPSAAPAKMLFVAGQLARNTQGVCVGKGDMRAQIQ